MIGGIYIAIDLNSLGTEYHKFWSESGVNLWAWVPDLYPDVCIGCPNAKALGKKVRNCSLQDYFTERLKEKEAA
jgi:hypothetical protein